MKRKLLKYKSVKTLKSLMKNLNQKADGKEKQILQKEKELEKILNDIVLVRDVILDKEND